MLSILEGSFKIKLLILLIVLLLSFSDLEFFQNFPRARSLVGNPSTKTAYVRTMKNDEKSVFLDYLRSTPYLTTAGKSLLDGNTFISL